MKMVLALAAIAAALTTAGPALAHSFDTIFVVPITGPQAAAGEQAQDGFNFAARERDGHPDETADGHLGGLDVYLRVVDSAANAPDVAAAVRQLAQRSADDAPWVVGPAELLAVIQDRVGAAEWLPINLAGASAPDVRTMDGRPFRAAFEQAFGYAPTPAVIAGYGAARQIDQTVRGRN